MRKKSAKNRNISPLKLPNEDKNYSGLVLSIVKDKNILSIIIILFLILLFLLIIILLDFQIINLSLIEKKEIKEFQIIDSCSLIVGKLIHMIGDEDRCKMLCKTNCETRKMHFFDSNFNIVENNCNSCKCYCK